jgi:hypothetical protein
MRLFLVNRFPIDRIDQALIVGTSTHRPIWQEFKAVPTPDFASNARDPAWFAALKTNLEHWGVRNPVLLWEYDGCGAVAPVKGASRIAAYRELGEKTIPALVSSEAAPLVSAAEIKTGLVGALSCFDVQPVKAVWYPDCPFYAEWLPWRAPA